jgi:DNA-binding transcriptional LysR family regulator
MFELHHLRYFVAVARELNFRRAAEQLNITQPPLTRQIQLLEHQLGVALLVRTRRTVRLTAAGRAFLPEAQNLLQRAQMAALTARRIGEGSAGSVTMGFVAGASYSVLPPFLSAARTRLPEIDLVLREMNTIEQLEALASRRIDLGLVRPPLDRREVEARCVLREPFALALPSKHRLARQRRFTISDLDGVPFLMYSPSDWQPFYELLAGMFQSHDVRPRVVQYIGSTHAILSLVNAGMGVALVPDSARHLKPDQVSIRPVLLEEGVRAELHLVWRADNDNPALPSLRDLMLSSAGGEVRSRRLMGSAK